MQTNYHLIEWLISGKLETEELSLFDSWKNLMVYKLDKNDWNRIIVWKLFAFDMNT